MTINLAAKVNLEDFERKQALRRRKRKLDAHAVVSCIFCKNTFSQASTLAVHQRGQVCKLNAERGNRYTKGLVLLKHPKSYRPLATRPALAALAEYSESFAPATWGGKGSPRLYKVERWGRPWFVELSCLLTALGYEGKKRLRLLDKMERLIAAKDVEKLNTLWKWLVFVFDSKGLRNQHTYQSSAEYRTIQLAGGFSIRYAYLGPEEVLYVRNTCANYDL